MPKLGLTMSEGTITEWLVVPGEVVELGQAVAVVETDKIASEIESPAQGVFGERLFEVGAVVDVGVAIARLRENGDAISRSPSAPGASEGRPELRLIAVDGAGLALPTHESAQPARSSTNRRNSTPYARKLARQAGLDIDSIVLPPGELRIVAADVECAVIVGANPQQRKLPASRDQAETIVDRPELVGLATIHTRMDIFPLITLLEKLRDASRSQPPLDAGLVLAFAAARILRERPDISILGSAEPARISIRSGFADQSGSIALNHTPGRSLSGFAALIEWTETDGLPPESQLVIRDFTRFCGFGWVPPPGLAQSATLCMSCEDPRRPSDGDEQLIATLSLSFPAGPSEQNVFEFLVEIKKWMLSPLELFS